MALLGAGSVWRGQSITGGSMAPIDRVEPLKDYLSAYVTDEGIDLPRLFNDDFFVATKLLWNAKHYISAAKLLMSAVGSGGF